MNDSDLEEDNLSRTSDLESSDQEYQSDLRFRLNKTIDEISQQLRNQYSPDFAEDLFRSPEDQRQRLMRTIEKLFVNMFTNLPPKITVANRSWSNACFDGRLQMKQSDQVTKSEIRFSDRRTLQKFCLISFVLGQIYKLLATHSTCTKRELFYQNVDKIMSQDLLDSVLNDITCLLECPLHELHIYATSKGLIYGPLQIVTPSGRINCENAGGTLIPNDISHILELNTSAKFILLVEKDAIFQKLLDDGASKNFDSCIFITGKGFPDVNTRMLLKYLWNSLSIPIFALVDPDPWGIEIMCVYRFGSLSLMHQADYLAVASIRWLGIFPSEIERFYDTREPLSEQDVSKVHSILQRPYVQANPRIRAEIQVLLDKSYKAEIEGIEITSSYLTNVYLPQKILFADFI